MAGPVDMISLTGGPCAGKTSGIVQLVEAGSEAGCITGRVAEVATRKIRSGVNPRKLAGVSRQNLLKFQRNVLLAQLQDEAHLAEELQLMPGAGRRIIICDRGAMDVAAYLSPDEFDELLASMNLTRPELLNRYVWVGHLVSAAIGAEQFYTLENNEARSESIEEARQLDARTQEAWNGHPRVQAIDNSTDFPTKLRRLRAAFQRAIGLPVNVQHQAKFVLGEPVNVKKLPVAHEEIEIEQAYLPTIAGDAEDRVRCWCHRGVPFYTRTFKAETDNPLAKVRREEAISGREYARLLHYRILSGLPPIKKRRVCFVHEGQYFRMDVFTSPDHLIGLTVLEVEPTELNDRVRLPKFLGAAEDVTGDARYTNRRLYEERAPEAKRKVNGWRIPWLRKK